MMQFTVSILISTVILGITSATSMYNSYCTQHTAEYVNLTAQGTTRVATRTMSDGEDPYSDNLFCSWTVDAGIGNRVHIEVDLVDLGPASGDYNCDYESTYAVVKQENIMDSYDWLNAEAGLFYMMCADKYPTEFTSRNRDLIIEFGSKINTENYRGINFVASSIPQDVCPNWWVERTTDNISYCYKVFNKVTTWVDAQAICTIQQGNLVSIVDEDEASFINELAVNSSALYPDIVSQWSIGLHNVYNMGDYKWINKDNSSFTFDTKWSSGASDSVSNKCVVLLQDGTWDRIPCYSSTNRFICKAQKDAQSLLYKLENRPTLFPPSSSSITMSCLIQTFLIVVLLIMTMH